MKQLLLIIIIGLSLCALTQISCTSSPLDDDTLTNLPSPEGKDTLPKPDLKNLVDTTEQL